MNRSPDRFYRVEKKEPVAWIYLNRPEKKNALGPQAWTELGPIFEDITADEAIRAVIIAGEGKDFSSGIDLVGMAPMVPAMAEGDRSARGMNRLFQAIYPIQEALSTIERCAKPVICAFHGYSIGAALDLGAACDIRLASADARISLRETALAFIADLGVLQRLPHIVGQGITRELAFTARFIDAERAKAINLVNELYPDKETLLQGAGELALEIAAQAPLAVQGTKEVLNYCRGKSIADGLEYAAARSAMILPSEDLTEAVLSFVERRKPQYKGK
jgi:enoyl-CoA hydratase